MPARNKQKSMIAIEKLAANGRALLGGDVEAGFAEWKTEVLTVARMIFGHDTPEYSDLDRGFWRYEQYFPPGHFEPHSDLPMAVKNVISILEGQHNALGYDLDNGV